MAHVPQNGVHAPMPAGYAPRPPFVAVGGQPVHPLVLQGPPRPFGTPYPAEVGYRPAAPRLAPPAAGSGDAFDDDPSNEADGGGGAGAHAWAKNSPATIQWLVDNYETAEGVSLPRSTLYEHYQEYCGAAGVDPVNAASFGKLIRHIFPNLKTRRLGTRGNSKYHYYGIRVKPTSSLAAHHAQHDEDGHYGGAYGEQGRGGAQDAGVPRAREDAPQQSEGSAQNAPAASAPSLPDFGALEAPDVDAPSDALPSLASSYRAHCERVLDAVARAAFPEVETIWRQYWQGLSESHRRLVSAAPVVAYLQRCDALMYETMVEALVPDVLRPLPVALTQAIRHFAKSLEGWMTFALEGQPEALVMAKLTAVAALSQTLRRYTSLNHLAQAARAVLHNPDQIAHMLGDLNRVDFANVHEQAAWVCQCPEDTVRRLEGEFKQYLQQHHTLEQWAQWLQRVVGDALGGGPGSGGASVHSARQFLMRWSFYSSLVIRDLTLRSAQSFGSFHLMRLLYDEYMFYLVERHVAAHSGGAAVGILARDFTSPLGARGSLELSGGADVKGGEPSGDSAGDAGGAGKRPREGDSGAESANKVPRTST